MAQSVAEHGGKVRNFLKRRRERDRFPSSLMHMDAFDPPTAQEQELCDYLSTTFGVSDEKMPAVLSELRTQQLASKGRLAEALEWYGSPTSPFRRTPITEFPEDPKKLREVVSRLMTCLIQGKAHHDDPWDD